MRIHNDDTSGQIHTLHTDGPDRRPCPHFDLRGAGIATGAFYDCPLGQSFHPQLPGDELWDHEQAVDLSKFYVEVYDGKEEFAKFCAACHTEASLAGQNKATIGVAIATIPEMKIPALEGMKPVELNAIGFTLSNPTP